MATMINTERVVCLIGCMHGKLESRSFTRPLSPVRRSSRISWENAIIQINEQQISLIEWFSFTVVFLFLHARYCNRQSGALSIPLKCTLQHQLITERKSRVRELGDKFNCATGKIVRDCEHALIPHFFCSSRLGCRNNVITSWRFHLLVYHIVTGNRVVRAIMSSRSVESESRTRLVERYGLSKNYIPGVLYDDCFFFVRKEL